MKFQLSTHTFLLIQLLVLVSLLALGSAVAVAIEHGNGYLDTPAPSTPAPELSHRDAVEFTPGVLFLDLVNVYGSGTAPLLTRINVARSGATDPETGKPGSLVLNMALDALDLSAFISRNVSQSAATASAVKDVPIVDNAVFMLYCDTTRYVDHMGNVRRVDPSKLHGAAAGQDTEEHPFWGSNLCNTVNLYLKMPATGSSRVQWLFYAAEKQLASAREVSNFTKLSRYFQETEWDVPHTLSQIKDLMFDQKYCRDVVDECVFHAFSCSRSFQNTKLAPKSERLPVYNLKQSRFYPKQQFHNLWSAIESPAVAPAMPSDLAAPTSATKGSSSGSGSSTQSGGGGEPPAESQGPFGNRMSMHMANLETHAWLMTVNRMPPLQLLTTAEAQGPADSATLLLQLEARPSSLSPEGFYTIGALLCAAAVVGICVFLVICKAIVPRILFLREVEATGGAAALQQIDEELIERFERERHLEEARNATMAHLGRVTGAPLTPEDLDALENFTQLPVGDMILSAIVEERQREMKEQLSTVSDKVAALPRVLFARALRLVDRSLFSSSPGAAQPQPQQQPAETPAEQQSASADSSNAQQQQQQQSSQNGQHQDPVERREELMQQRRNEANQRRAAELRDAEMRAQIEQVQQFQEKKQRELEEQLQIQQEQHDPSDSAAVDVDPNRPSAEPAQADSASAAAAGNGDDQTNTHDLAVANNQSFSFAARQEQHQRAAALLRSLDNREMGIADADISELLGSTAMQVRNNVQHRISNTVSGVGKALQQSRHFVVEKGFVLTDALGVTHHTAPQEQGQQQGGEMQQHAGGATQGESVSKLEIEVPEADQGHPDGPQDAQVMASPIAVQQREILMTTQVEVPACGENASSPIVCVSAVVLPPPPSPPAPAADANDRQDERQHQQQDFASEQSHSVAAEEEHDEVPVVVATPARNLAFPPLAPAPLAGGGGSSAHRQHASNSLGSVPTVAYGVVPRGASSPTAAARTPSGPFPSSPRAAAAGNTSPTAAAAAASHGLPLSASSPQLHQHSVHSPRYESALQRHLQEDERSFDVCRNEALPLKFSVDAKKAIAMGSPRMNQQVHSQQDIYGQMHQHHLHAAGGGSSGGGLSDMNPFSPSSPSSSSSPVPGSGGAAASSSSLPPLQRPEHIPRDVPCCRYCLQVIPFVDLMPPCQCTKEDGRRYIHRRCLEAERKLDAFADGGVHAEYCWRCRYCRGRYTIAPNSISMWSAIPQKSPLSQMIQKLLNNPVAPLLALWILVYLTGYIVKFISATMTLDYLGTDWSALRVYHWVLGAWFLLSFSLCERTLRQFFEIFEPATRRIVIIVVAAVAPLLLGYIGHFCIVCFSYASWSWESFYGLGVCVEALLFFTVVPRLALFGASGAGALYDHLPPSVQNCLQHIVP